MPATNAYVKNPFYGNNVKRTSVPKPKTDITHNHHPHEYEVISCNKDAYGGEKIIYIGTFKQCKERDNEIANFDCDYARKVHIRKVK